MVGFPQMFDLGSLLPPLPLALHANGARDCTYWKIITFESELGKKGILSSLRLAFFSPCPIIISFGARNANAYWTDNEADFSWRGKGGEKPRSLDKGENQIKVYDNKNVVCVSSSSSVTNKKCRRALLILGLLSST